MLVESHCHKKRMNMNFLDEVQAILKYMPKKHVTCLFSATYPAVIQRMSKKYLYKPTKIDLTSTNKPNILKKPITSMKNIKNYSFFIYWH